MWGTIMHNPKCSWEPMELRILKQELATLACKCNTCESLRNPSLSYRGHQNDEAVQVDQKSHILDKYIYATSGISTEDTRPTLDYFRRDVLCPYCYFILDLLRKTTKVLKDAESEVRPESSDKSTEKAVNFADSATSVNNNLPPTKVSSKITLCDFSSVYSSGSSMSHHSQDATLELFSYKKKNNRERVTFEDEYPSKEVTQEQRSQLIMHGNCFCLDKYIDSIRPPLTHFI